MKVFHRRIEKFFQLWPQAVDLVDEQDVAVAERGEQPHQVARPLEHRPRRGAALHAHLARHQQRERGLAESGWAEEEYVVECLTPLLGGVDRDLE